jgi:SAM-dependent methyltransferase
MELTKLASLFACPACGRAQATHEPGAALVCGACGKRYGLCGMSVQTVASAPLSDAWKQKQAEGEARYRDEHYNADDTIARLFGGFVAATLRRDAVVLDIGCGIQETPPAYVAELGLENYIGLEPLADAMPRRYACLAGAVAEKIPLKDGSVDALLFATSLDHIERVGLAYEEARRVLAKGGRLYIWNGLYEPEIMARSQTYYPAFFGGSVPGRLLRFALLQGVYARFAQLMLVRKYKLLRKLPIDEKHFRYYTQRSLAEELGRHGLTVERSLVVPGSNSMFVQASFAG